MKNISKTHRLTYTAILVLTLTMPMIAQTREKLIDAQSPIQREISAAGHRISGVLTMNSDGQPIAKADIEVRDIGRPAVGKQFFARQTQTDERGRWTIDKVPDGDYLLIAKSASKPVKDKNGWFREIDSEAITEFVARAYEVKMAGTDLDNFAVQVIKGGRITGKIIMDGGESLPEGLIVLPEQIAVAGRSPVRFAPVQPDGSFILESVPVGDIFFKAVVFGKVKEFYTKSATVGGVNLLRETLSIKDGSEVSGVHILFAKTAEK